MTGQRVPGAWAQVSFRIVSAAALLSAFAQVTLGGVVRVTGSGLGCPDWPLCHGRVVPPFDTATLIEYSHRLSGSALGVLVIATVVLAWTFYRSRPRVVASSIFGLVMVVIAGILGGITVLTDLVWWVRLFHLGVAETVVAAMAVALVSGWRSPAAAVTSAEVAKPEAERFNRMVLASGAGVFLLILSGSYMVGYGAGSSCGTWPLCNGSLFPQGGTNAIHMGHRLLAAIVGLLVLATAFAAWARRERRPEIGWGHYLMRPTILIRYGASSASNTTSRLLSRQTISGSLIPSCISRRPSGLQLASTRRCVWPKMRSSTSWPS